MTRPNKIISLILTFAIILTSLIFNNQDFSAKSYFDSEYIYENGYFIGDHVHFGFWNKNPQGENLSGGEFKLTNKRTGTVLYSAGNIQTEGENAYIVELPTNQTISSKKLKENYMTQRTVKTTVQEAGYYKLSIKGEIDRLFSDSYYAFISSSLNNEDGFSYGYIYMEKNETSLFYINSKEDLEISLTKIESLKLNETKTININNIDELFLTFEAGDVLENKYYVLEYSNCNYLSTHDIYAKNDNWHLYPESMEETDVQREYFCDSTYEYKYPLRDDFYFKFYFENNTNINEDFSIKIREMTNEEFEALNIIDEETTNATELKLNEDAIISTEQYRTTFKFIPEETGFYNFKGYNINADYSINCYLYSWQMLQMGTSHCNVYNDETEYNINAYLEAGKTYYFEAEAGNADYLLKVTKTTNTENINESNIFEIAAYLNDNNIETFNTENTDIINGIIPENASFNFELNAENEGSALIFTFTPSKTGKYSFKAERNYPDTENNYYYKYGYIFSQIVEIEGEDSYIAYLGEDNEKMVLLNANQTYYIRWENNWDDPAYYGTYTITNNLISEIEQFENNKEYSTNSSLILLYTTTEEGLYSFEFDFNNKIKRNIYFQVQREDGSYNSYGWGEEDFWVNTNYEENIDYARTYIEANQTILINIDITPSEDISETTLISKAQKLDDTGLIGFIDTYLESENIYDENDNFVKRIDSCEWILEQVVAPEGYSLNTKKYEIRYEEITYSDYSTEEKLYIDGVDTFLAPWDFINEPLRDEGAIITFATNLTEPLNLILTNNETQEIIFGSFNTEKTTLNLPAGTYILKQINNPTIILNSISLENEIEGVSLTFENNEYILTISENINNSIPLLIKNEENHDRGYIDLSNKENLFKPNNPTSGPSGEPYVSDSVLIYGNWYQGQVAE